MKKRFGLLLTLTAVMAAVLALSAAGASAQTECTITDAGLPKHSEIRVETVVTTETETTNTTQPCEVGNSGRQGAQAGTLTETFRVTTTTTTTTVYRGEDIIFGPDTDPPVVERELLSSEFSPTGPCRNIPGSQ